MNKFKRVFLIATASALAGLLFRSKPSAKEINLNSIIKDFAGDSEHIEGLVKLTTPEIAENGHSVPVSVEVESPMTPDDYVDSIIVLAEANPNIEVARFKFSPLSGEAKVSTRIRLADTQDVVAIAKLSNGKFYKTANHVEVTIGGCGA